MNCVVCENRSGYNRAVVDLDTGHELGGLCIRCERTKLGECSDELGDPDSETCVFCDRDGFWALPKWLPSTYQTDDGAVSYVDYDPSATPLTLCDEHLARVGVDDITTARARRDERVVRGRED